VRERRHPRPAGQGAPFPQELHIGGDVERFVVASVLIEPILGVGAVRSGGSGVELDLRHLGPFPVDSAGLAKPKL
jgi:hypothetical protein